jgi:hypothetical protein
MIKELQQASNVIIICVASVIFTLIVASTIYFIHDKTLMSKNMDNAIAKGMDPLSVRCSYVKSDDIICIAFASSSQSHYASAPSSKK